MVLDATFAQKSSTRRLTVWLLDSAGSGVTGLSPSIRIHDEAASEFLRNDATWGAIGTDYTMTEVDATSLPGLYEFDFTLRSTATEYDIRVDGGISVNARYHFGKVIAMDSDADELHLVKAMLANKRTHTVSTGVDKVYDDDGSTLLKTMTPTDDGNDTVTVTPS